MKYLKLFIVTVLTAFAIPTFGQLSTDSKLEQPSPFNEDAISSGYKGMVDIGYAFGTGNYGIDRLMFTTSHGYQVNSFLFLGIGAGINYYTDGGAGTIPIFADFRGTAPIANTRIAPFLDIKIGYTIMDIEGFYFAPSVGVRIALSRKIGLNLALGYEIQKIDAFGRRNENNGAFAIKMGIDF